MIYTNNHDLPDYLQRWLEQDDYDYVEGVISATGLLSPIRQTVLKSRHFEELEIDLADLIARRIGTGIHKSFEEVVMPRITQEQRGIVEIDGRKISGKYDMLKDLGHGRHRIIDIKTTGVYNYMYGNSAEEWKMQLSIYKYILEHDGWKVDNGQWSKRKAIKVDQTAEICLVFTDWKSGEAKQGGKYPPLRVGNIDMMLYGEPVVVSFIKEQLHRIEEAEQLDDHDLPICTDEELWKDKDKYRVMKQGNKKATRVFETEREAQGFIDLQTSKEYRIDLEEGKVKHCPFCDARSRCTQYPQLIADGLIEVTE